MEENKVLLLSDLITKEKHASSIHKEGPILFKSVSMALFDACIGNYVYKKAKKLEYGFNFKL